MKKLFTVILTVGSLFAAAQSSQFAGQVTDEYGSALSGVNVQVLGKTGKGTSTTQNGSFVLEDIFPGDVIRFSYVGMKPFDMTFDNQSGVQIILESEAALIEEVVVIGYGTQTKRDLTGSYSSVTADQLASQPAMTAAQSLQGKVAGVQIVSSGAPGANPQVRIRGTGTLLGGADPLYVVDGVLTNDIRNLSTSDIKSMEILKDASSAAIYGVRGANGVIIITTNQGYQGKLKIDFNSYTGINVPQRHLKMASSDFYIQYTNESLQAQGDAPLFPEDYVPEYNTDWFKNIRRTGILQDYSLALSGGSEKVNYYGSVSFYQNEGILEHNNYSRLTVRVNLDYKISKVVQIGLNLGVSYNDSENMPYSAFTNAYRFAPVIPVNNPDGSYGFFPNSNVANPVAQLNYTHDNSNGIRMYGNAYVNVNIVKGLSFRTSFSSDWNSGRNRIYNPKYQVSQTQLNQVSELSVERNSFYNWIWDNIFTYDLTMPKNTLKVTLGMTSEAQSSNYLKGSRRNVPNDKNYWFLNLGDQTTMTNDNNGTYSTRVSYLGRVFYAFDNRYLITATGRFDGSSKFPSSNRWGFFPSVGLAWRLSQEKFMQGTTGVLSDLKIRGSYGQIGNDAIPADAFIFTVTNNLSYVTGKDQNAVPGGIVTEIKDKNLKWEKTEEWNVGVDFAFFDSRFSGVVDYYDKKTNSALIYSPIDAIFGDPTGSFLTNKADIHNNGVELTLNWADNVREKFSYNVGVNFTYNKNQITNVSDGIPIVDGLIGNGQSTTLTQVGQPVGAFWVFETDGIFQTQEQLNEWTAAGNPVFPGTQVGELRYIDRNGDGVLDDDDRYSPGAYSPKFMLGLNFGFEFFNFDFSVEMYANMGNKIYNGKKALRFGYDNIEASLSDRWTPEHTNTNIPRASNKTPISSDYYIEDGSYFKFNTITLGYSFRQQALQNAGIQKLRLYLSALNPLVFMKFSGYTPELPAGTLNSGIELNAYPQIASFMFGINFTL